MDKNPNIIYASFGNDIIDGLDGRDTLTYSLIDQDLYFNISDGNSTASFLNYSQKFINIENLIGSSTKRNSYEIRNSSETDIYLYKLDSVNFYNHSKLYLLG
jgi:hypothetical protein